MALYLYEKEYKKLPLYQRTQIDLLWFPVVMTDSEDSDERTETEAP